jgi:hypothetical protein
MTEPQPVMEQTEQDRLTRQVGRSLLTVAGPDWTQVRAEYRAAGRHIEVDVFVTGPDGQPRPMRPPQEVVDGLGRLRQGMYRPGRGTWLSALYQLDPPSTFAAEFEPDIEPRWRRVPPPIGFADELRFFPRADEHIPDWWRQRAGLPPAGGEQATPPGGFQQPPAGQGPPTGPPSQTPQGGFQRPGHATPPGGTRQPGYATPGRGTTQPGSATPPHGTQQPSHATAPGGTRQPSHPNAPAEPWPPTQPGGVRPTHPNPAANRPPNLGTPPPAQDQSRGSGQPTL